MEKFVGYNASTEVRMRDNIDGSFICYHYMKLIGVRGARRLLPDQTTANRGQWGLPSQWRPSAISRILPSGIADRTLRKEGTSPRMFDDVTHGPPRACVGGQCACSASSTHTTSRFRGCWSSTQRLSTLLSTTHREYHPGQHAARRHRCVFGPSGTT